MNELLFLGTGAADWDSKIKGEFFRHNSAALLNRELMLDCGKHIFNFRDDYEDEALYDYVTDIIITHNHSDHWCRESVYKLATKNRLRIACDGAVRRLIGEHENIEYVELKLYEYTKMGKYEIMPLLANHDIVCKDDMMSLHYIVKTPDKREIFYGLDGAWFLRSSWEEMLLHKFDIMVFDCTVGDRADWRMFEHNTIPMLRMMLDEINARNMLNENGVYIASHLARTLHETHEETAYILNKINTLTAYDGMRIKF